MASYSITEGRFLRRRWRKNKKVTTSEKSKNTEELNFTELEENPELWKGDLTKVYYIAMNKNLPEDFAEKFRDILGFGCLCNNPNLSENFFRKMIDIMGDEFPFHFLACSWYLSEDFFISVIENFSIGVYARGNWYRLSTNETLKEKFFDKAMELGYEVDLNVLGRREDISPEFFERHGYIKPERKRKNSHRRYLRYLPEVEEECTEAEIGMDHNDVFEEWVKENEKKETERCILNCNEGRIC